MKEQTGEEQAEKEQAMNEQTANEHPSHVLVRRFVDDVTDIAITPLPGGLVHQTFEVRTAAGHYVLQAFNDRVFTSPADVMANFRTAREHLADTDYPLTLPEAIPSRDGRWLVADGQGRLWRLSTFIAGTTSHERPPDVTHVHEAARAYGAFLTHLRDLPATRLVTTIPHFHDPASRRAALERALANASPERRRDSAAALAATVEATRALRHDFHTLPVRATHNDCKLGNLLFHRERAEAVAVIDWDTLMPGHVVTDFGDMARTLCNTVTEEAEPGDVAFDADACEALESGFVESTQTWLTPTERARLFDGALYIVFEQALRFLTDHLGGDTYYGARYPGHNRVRAENQLALFGAMRRHVAST